MNRIEIVQQMDAHLRVIEQVKETLTEPILECADILADVLGRGGKLLVMGNGGSAADAQHLAAELVGRCGKSP